MGGRFEGRVALITGGASGMGAAFAQIFVDEGGSVAIADLNDELGAQFAEGLGSKAVYLRTDVSIEDDVAATVDAAMGRFDRIDVLFNNAGIGGMGSTSDTSADLWRKVLEVDLFSVFYCSKAVIPHMKAIGGGAIINNASISGLAGDFGMASYNAAKGGIVNYTKNLALDLAGQGIRVNAICPGAIDTALFSGVAQVPGLLDAFINAIPLGRLGAAKEVAEIVAFLASDAASYVTGAAIPVDGGVVAATGLPNLNRFMEGLKAKYA